MKAQSRCDIAFCGILVKVKFLRLEILTEDRCENNYIQDIMKIRSRSANDVCSLHEIFSTAAGQLSDRLMKSFRKTK